MAAQNLEALLEALHQKKIHLEISKASDSLWQISLTFPEQEKESQPSGLLATDSSILLSESNATTSQSNLVNTPDINSAEQLKESSSSDSSAPDSPVQPSKLEPTASQSNPIDLPDINLAAQSSTSDTTTSAGNQINSANQNLAVQQSTQSSKRKSKRDSEKVRDVFLCYNSKDYDLVKSICFDLENKWNVKCWIDKRDVGGGIWDEILNKQAKTVKSVAIFLSKNGIGPRQIDEIHVFREQARIRSLVLIPVLFPGFDKSQIPPNLSIYNYVDFHRKDYDPVEELVRVFAKVSPRKIAKLIPDKATLGSRQETYPNY